MSDSSTVPLAHGAQALRRQPRVSIIAADLSSRGAGRWGGGVRPFILGQALQQAGYGVDIIGFTNNLDDDWQSSPVPVHPIPVGDSPLSIRAISSLLGQLRGDILYASKPKSGSLGLALIHRVWSRKPVLLDIDDWELSWHGGDHYRYRPHPRQLLRDLLQPQGALRDPNHPLYLQGMERLIPWADQITTHSSFLQQRFGGLAVPNGKDTDRFDPTLYSAEASRREYGLSPYRVLMFPGAPRPYKGLEDVLQALDFINADDLKLVIVGGSPYDDYDQHLLSQWSRHIIHLGRQPLADMPKLVTAAHVVVVPQRQTAAAAAQFPLKLTDGMAMAKPVLATRVGDLPTILGDTGYLVEPNAPESLAGAIQMIFADYDGALRRGCAARQRCVERYSIRAMGQTLQPLLRSLMPVS